MERKKQSGSENEESLRKLREFAEESNDERVKITEKEKEVY